MQETFRNGAKGALLDIYENAIAELCNCLDDISDNALIKIVDSQTKDPNCISIQTILTHVLSAGFSYAVYIRQLKGENVVHPGKPVYNTIKEYQTGLSAVFDYTVSTFKNIQDSELEDPDNSKKIITPWHQSYDIEQIAEHAIVHILRHMRQIERFNKIICSENSAIN